MKGIKDTAPHCVDSGLVVIVKDKNGIPKDFIPIQDYYESKNRKKKTRTVKKDK